MISMQTFKLFHITILLLVAGVLTACSKDNGKDLDLLSKEMNHIYKVEISGRKTYEGKVPKKTGGVYYPVSMVEYSEENQSKILTGLLMDSGKFQIGVGMELDAKNNPRISKTGPGLTFGEWGYEEKYKPSGNILVNLDNYTEHKVNLYGEESTVASYILTFSGNFKLGNDGDEVTVTGKLVVAAP